MATLIQRSVLLNRVRIVPNLCRQVGSINEQIRTAQAAEIFRSSFYNSQNLNTTISVSDLDELVKSENVRPSLLLCGLEIAGTGLGILSKFAPKQYSELITNVVDDATIQHFNDSIGVIQEKEGEEHDDIKETLKFHRDIHNFDNNEIKGTNVVLTAGLYKMLDITKTV